MNFRRVAALLCVVPVAAIGCGGDSKDDSDPKGSPSGSTTQPTSAPPAGDVLIRDVQNDASGPAERAPEVDLRSVSLLRKRDIVIARARFWMPLKGDVVIRMEFEAGGQKSEVLIVRRAGQLAAKRGPGQPIDDAKVTAAKNTIAVQLSLDSVTSKSKFGFRAVAKSDDGKAEDVAPDAPAEFPSGRER